MKISLLLKTLLKPHGMAMPEVFIAAGLLGIIAIATIKLTDNLEKDSKAIEVTKAAIVAKSLNNANTVPGHCVASGKYSFCQGYEGIASGDLSVALAAGNWTNFPTQATNAGSVAIGVGAKSTGLNSLAMGGKWAVASGQESVAIGRSTQALANYSFASGYDSHATKEFALVFGNTSRAEGERALALGNEATARGVRSIAIGNYVTAEAPGSLAMGDATMGTLTNNVANSFKARFDGGFAFHTDASDNDLTSVQINNQGKMAIGTRVSEHRLQVANGTTSLEQEKERTPTLMNNWKVYNGLELTFFKDSSGVVHISGGLCNSANKPGDGINNCGTPGSHENGFRTIGRRLNLKGDVVPTQEVSIHAFTLPSEYRPNRIIISPCAYRYPTYPQPQECSVWVNPGGAVHVYASHPEHYPMLNLSFRAY